MSSVEFTTPFEFIVGVAANRDHGPVGQRSAPVAGVVAAPRFPVLAPTKRLEKPGLAKWVPRPYWDENYCIHAQKIVYIINRYNHIYVCVAICSPSWKKTCTHFRCHPRSGLFAWSWYPNTNHQLANGNLQSCHSIEHRTQDGARNTVFWIPFLWIASSRILILHTRRMLLGKSPPRASVH